MNKKIIRIVTSHFQTWQNKALTQEDGMKIKNLKRILNEQKTWLQSLKTQDWRTIKAETEKLNK